MKKLILFTALLLASCGTEQLSDLEVVNGTKVYKSFYGRFEVGGGFRCGSTLIKKRWSLTAKHCIPDKNRDKIKVRFGAFDMNKPNNAGKPFDLVPVSKVFMHPNRDIALLKLSRDAKFDPIDFHETNLPAETKLQTFGMGNKALGVSGGGILRGAVLTTLDGPNPNIIYTKAGEKGICHGDSGGPLINPKNKKLVGVTSWTGSNCSSRNGRDGFTKPDSNWIKGIIK